jgi:hypothetical protein
VITKRKRFHSAWTGFKRVKDINNAKSFVAKCRKCKGILKTLDLSKCKNISQSKKPKLSCFSKIKTVFALYLRCQKAKGTSESPPAAFEPEPTTSSKRNSENDHEQDPALKKMKVSGKLSIIDFMDQLDSQTKEKTDISIAKFFYQSGTNSNAIKSSFLKHAMKKLRPSYTLPSVSESSKTKFMMMSLMR